MRKTLVMALGTTAKKPLVIMPTKLHKQLVFALNFATGLSWRSVVLVSMFGEYTVDPTVMGATDAAKLWGFFFASSLLVVPLALFLLRRKTLIAVELERAYARGDLKNMERLMGTSIMVSQLVDCGLVHTLTSILHLAVASSFPVEPKWWVAVQVLTMVMVLSLLATLATSTKRLPFMMSKDTIAAFLRRKQPVARRTSDVLFNLKLDENVDEASSALLTSESGRRNMDEIVDYNTVSSIFTSQHEDINDTITTGSADIVGLSFHSLMWVLFNLHDTTRSTNLGELWGYAAGVFIVCLLAAKVAESWAQSIGRSIAAMAEQETHVVAPRTEIAASSNGAHWDPKAVPPIPGLSNLKASSDELSSRKRLWTVKRQVRSVGLTMAKLVCKAVTSVSVITLYAAIRATLMLSFRPNEEVYEPLPVPLSAVYTFSVAVIVVLVTMSLEVMSFSNIHSPRVEHVETPSHGEEERPDSSCLDQTQQSADLANSASDPPKRRLLVEVFAHFDSSLRKNLFIAMEWVTGLAMNDLTTAVWQQLVLKEEGHLRKHTRGIETLLAFVYATSLTLLTVALMFKWTKLLRARAKEFKDFVVSSASGRGRSKQKKASSDGIDDSWSVSSATITERSVGNITPRVVS